MTEYLNDPKSTIKKQLKLERLKFDLVYKRIGVITLTGEIAILNTFSNRTWVNEAYCENHVISLEHIKVGKRRVSVKGIAIKSFYYCNNTLHVDLIGYDVNVVSSNAKEKVTKEKVVFT